MTPECKIRFSDLPRYNVCFGPGKSPEPTPVFFSRFEWKFLLDTVSKETKDLREGEHGVWCRVLETLTRAREAGIVHVR